jgi:predicted small lipoprotein YifL
VRLAPKAVGYELGRALKPGPVHAAAVLLIAIAAVAGCGGGGSKYPSYLPKSTLNPPVDALLTGTVAKPALTVEGLPVEIKSKAFDVRMTVSGPIVPGEGLPYQPDATTCTWTVTMRNATADVPVSLADFHAVDHLYSVTVPVLAPGQHALPRVLHPGQALTFRLRAYMLVGEGTMQWSPDHRHEAAIWDYTVEND